MKMTMGDRTFEVDPERSVTDDRVDAIGALKFMETRCGELVSETKEAALSAGAKRVRGALYEGQISQAEESTSVDALKFLALAARKRLSRVEIASVLRVDKRKLGDLLSGKEISSISRPTPPSDPALSVRPIGAVDPDAVQKILLVTVHQIMHAVSQGRAGRVDRPDRPIDQPAPADASRGASGRSKRVK